MVTPTEHATIAAIRARYEDARPDDRHSLIHDPEDGVDKWQDWKDIGTLLDIVAKVDTPIPTQAWVFAAQLDRVIDGDTIVVTLDLGFHLTWSYSLRLLGINCPEVHGATKDAGLAAAAYTQAWLDAAAVGGAAWPLLVMTHKSDDFGRYLARVWRLVDNACLNDDLLTSGHAVPFMI